MAWNDAKREMYARIHEEMDAADFLHLGKAEQKARLDDWFARGLQITEATDDPLTNWEKLNYRDAMAACRDGLYWLSRAALYKAVMPDAPASIWPAPPEGEIEDITLEKLQAGRDWLAAQECEPHPIFLRR